MRFISIGEAAAELGAAVATLRRWDRQGRLTPAGRTIGGHRHYERESVHASLGSAPKPAGKIVYHARVSSHDQAGQLKTRAAGWKITASRPASPVSKSLLTRAAVHRIHGVGFVCAIVFPPVSASCSA
ncbi:MerR family DNA-binding transcriptional regulator [Paraburkholderia sp. RL17-337-BIB-A]|uniref:MerR family DNA-binding transcriptional regulator n=1 Tax=Paraburkholderia sp. RL17-337-BIB-A TaxID=3031636 RepID=UPI0038BAF1AB